MSASHSPSTTAPTTGRVTVREADGEADAWYLQRQWAHWFGAEYESGTSLQLDLFDIAGWSRPDDAPVRTLDTFGVIAEHTRPGHGSVRVGGAVALLLDHDEAVAELPDGRFDAATLAGDPTAWFMLGAVDTAWRGQGLGRHLFERRLQWARETDAEMALSCGWERTSGATSRPLFEATGWVPVQTVSEMYADTERSACPDCGVWPSDDDLCRCDATVWALDLSGGDDDGE